MEVEAPEDCANAPRKQLLLDFNIALAEADIEALLEWVDDDITWTLIGQDPVEGKQGFTKALTGSGAEVARLKISNIITHGPTAAVEGELEMENGFRMAFCDIYRFRGAGSKAKISSITAYVVGNPV